MPSIFSRPFLGHKAIFLTCVGYAKIDVMCCCCALMYMCLSCVDIGQLLAFLGCLVYQHIQTHYIYMFDCHGSVPDSWHMGETVGMRYLSLSLYLYITCMYRYIRILILTIIYSYICTYLYVKKTHYKKIVAVFLFLLFFYCFSPWFMVCRGFKTPLGSPLGSKTQSAYSLNCVPTGTTCTLPGRHRRPGWPSWKPSIGWTANSINAWILFIDQWKIKTMKIHWNRIYWNTHIWCIFLKMDSTEINISLIGLLEKNIGIIFHHWVSISEMDD